MTVAILLIVAAVVVFLNVVATWKVLRDVQLIRSQKIAQTILAWIIPFFGAVAVIVVSTDPAEREKRGTANVDSGGDVLGGGYFRVDGGGHHGSHGHGHGGDAGHGGDGGGHGHGGDGGGGH